jgi:nicotinate-nucleotide adenylyltransferase
LKLGLYGGTFDPIHNGHIHVITQLLTLNIVDRVLVIPAGEPRLRENAPIATGAQRRTMCQLAVNDLAPEFRSKVEVNPIEILRMGPSYTIDTVEAVKQTYPDDEIILIVGTDAHQKVDQWHRVDELLKMVTLEIIERPGALSGQGRDIDAIDLSATQVRLGQSDQLSPSVANYIKEHNLYVSKP